MFSYRCCMNKDMCMFFVNVCEYIVNMNKCIYEMCTVVGMSCWQQEEVKLDIA